MKDPIDFVESIYLGDRGLKAIVIDVWRGTVSFKVDLISRLEPGTRSWNYYAGGDIADGMIVLTTVESIQISPPGYIPNDYINSFDVAEIVPEVASKHDATFPLQFECW